MDAETLRLECLKLAATLHMPADSERIIEDAGILLRFVDLGQSSGLSKKICESR